MQRGSGVEIQSFGAFQRFSNPIIVPANSSITSFPQLVGKKLGTPSTTLLDWLIVYAAGKKAYGTDLQSQAIPVPASPSLRNQLLIQESISAALQFESLASTPVSTGKFRQLTTVTHMASSRRCSANSFRLLFIASTAVDKSHRSGFHHPENIMAVKYKFLTIPSNPLAVAATVDISQATKSLPT